MNKNTRLALWLTKLLNYEYWPYWIFYFPMVPYGIYLGLKARSLCYFSATNPTPHMQYGGLLNSSKTKILDEIEAQYKPKMILLPPQNQFKQVKDAMQLQQLFYPVVLKPDTGERGVKVEKINSDQGLKDYLNNQKVFPLLIQEFINFPYELGILFFKYPDGSAKGITSIVIKEFLTLEGDGHSTLQELMQQSTRAQLRKEYLFQKFEKQLTQILAEGEKLVLEPIGNHNRGTKFLNGNHLINDKLVQVFDRISCNISGYFYGRFDIKVKNLEDLYEGKNIQIMELNGIESEPAHVYDPSYTLWKAYQDIARHMKIINDIAIYNHKKNGVSYDSFFQMLKDIKQHSKDKKAANA